MDINYVYNTLENNPEMIGQREGSADFVTYEPGESEEGGMFVVNDMKGGMAPFEPSLDDLLADNWVCHA